MEMETTPLKVTISKSLFQEEGPLFVSTNRSAGHNENSGILRPKGCLDARSWALQEQILPRGYWYCDGEALNDGTGACDNHVDASCWTGSWHRHLSFDRET